MVQVTVAGRGSSPISTRTQTVATQNIVGSDSDSGDWVDEFSSPGRQSAGRPSLGHMHPEPSSGDAYYTGTVNSAGSMYAGASTSARASPYPSLRKKRRGTQGGVAPSERRAATPGPRGQAFAYQGIEEESPTPPQQPRPAVSPARPRAENALGNLNVETIVDHTSDYTPSVLRPAIRRLRVPLILIAFLFLLSLIPTWISSTLSSAFPPSCRIPGMSYTSLCNWVYTPDNEGTGRSGGRSVQWADYGTLFNVQSKTFERMVDDSLLGPVTPSSLSLSLKKSEMATADLIGLVRLSDLKNREGLAKTLSEFASDAREAGLSLARLDAKMNGALDSVMAVNEYALHQIESAQEQEPSRLASALMPWRQGKTVDEVVKEAFLDGMNILSENLERVVLEVLVNTQNLNALWEKLKTIHDIVARENKSVTGDRDALTSGILGHLWKELGVSDERIKNFDRNLGLLADIDNSRRLARERVAATLHTLQKADREMQDMRERVAAPNLARSKIPPEVHARIIRDGLDRLEEGRQRAKAVEREALRKAFAEES